MNLGSLAMAGANQPKNFFHIVFDNGVYGSTGNQATIAPQVSLADIARAAGYKAVGTAADTETLLAGLSDFLSREGPLFLLVKIEAEPEEKKIGRVTHEPPEIARRFEAALARKA
jgi:thiamine pyrophosphate-dependent acetolactate synthase large subunit-like protein